MNEVACNKTLVDFIQEALLRDMLTSRLLLVDNIAVSLKVKTDCLLYQA